MDAGKAKIKVPADLASAFFLASDNHLLAVSSHGKDRSSGLPLLIMTLIPSLGLYPHDLI